jgi:acetylornithine deacetylase
LTELDDLLAELVAIDSVNPALVGGGAGEREIAAFVAAWLEREGLEVEVLDDPPGRPSAVGVARGTGGGRSLLLCAHTDTGGVAGMEAPLEPRVREGRLYGRGGYDMKGGLAAIMAAGAAAARGGLRGDVIVAAVADEEHASVGCQAVAARWSADAAIVTEPTGLEVCVAHKGFAWLEIETHGRAAHGSRPDLGVDAIARMGTVLERLAALDAGLGEHTHPLLGRPSVHASLIEGGQEWSSYPERCVLRVERRTLPGETAGDVEAEGRDLIAGLDAEVRVDLVREPFEVDAGAPIVDAVRRHAGVDRVVGQTPWMDAAILSQAGIPTVVFGPVGEGAHALVEWVDLASVSRCAEVLAAVAAEHCA